MKKKMKEKIKKEMKRKMRRVTRREASVGRSADTSYPQEQHHKSDDYTVRAATTRRVTHIDSRPLPIHIIIRTILPDRKFRLSCGPSSLQHPSVKRRG